MLNISIASGCAAPSRRGASVSFRAVVLVLTAWHSVRPGAEGFLGSYPKSLLCPLSHTAPPAALEGLTTAKQLIFERRAPFYLRYLLREKFGIRTCADCGTSWPVDPDDEPGDDRPTREPWE